MLYLEDSEWNVDAFWLSPASLWGQACRTEALDQKSAVGLRKGTRHFLGVGVGSEANMSLAYVCSHHDCSWNHNFPLFLPINIIYPGHTKVLKNNGNRLLLSLSFNRARPRFVSWFWNQLQFMWCQMPLEPCLILTQSWLRSRPWWAVLGELQVPLPFWASSMSLQAACFLLAFLQLPWPGGEEGRHGTYTCCGRSGSLEAG